MKKKISIGDIARDLKVSKTTVSFVLNGKARQNHISPALEERVLKYMAEVGYSPNQMAQGLRTGKTKLIGMLVEDISDPFFSGIARVVEEKAFQQGYKVFFSSTGNDPGKANELLEVYRSRQVDGYIIAPTAGLEEKIRALLEDRLPVVIFDRFLPGLPVSHVVVNNFESAYNAVQYLSGNGYAHIAFLTVASNQVQMEQRRQGYLAAIDNQQQALIHAIPYHQDPARTVADIAAFLSAHRQVDAVFFATNYLAESGLEAIQHLGLRIPQDLGVLVFDDKNLFRLFSPPITAIAQPLTALSEATINLLLDYLTGNRQQEEGPLTQVIPTTLHIRKSCTPKGKGTGAGALELLNKAIPPTRDKN
jgi:LacI family transcriptional regulator